MGNEDQKMIPNLFNRKSSIPNRWSGRYTSVALEARLDPLMGVGLESTESVSAFQQFKKQSKIRYLSFSSQVRRPFQKVEK